MKKLLSFLLLLGACSPPSGAPPEEPPPPKPPSTGSAPSTGLVYQVPKEWVSEKPSSGMRKAQWALPDKDKAEGNATLAYFGAMGGGVEANISRWKGQFSTTTGEPKEETFKVGDLNVTLLEVSGDYAADMGGEPMKDAGMLAAIIETGSGDHVFKMVGPRGTVGDWRAEFVAMLKAVKAR